MIVINFMNQMSCSARSKVAEKLDLAYQSECDAAPV
jgi:hypothetical protein